MADYGSDISDFPDLDPMMQDYTGRLILLERLYRRLTTPRGALFYDANFGYNVSDLLNSSFGPGDLTLIQNDLVRECLKEEQIAAARAQVKYNNKTGELFVALTLQDGAGPFPLVLSVSQVTVKVLSTG